ncbi:hypothetical protein [Bacillus thuringiensis]|uniref:hypothetical protein n=1 Tax=Bacillus thuringiensis TaxID=1428 RepID=UPI000BEBBF09|nr:hypothetical protein [Bacillus thuringiensis]PEC13557.1 hypothetical protein CON19_28105 [Bacillus thuringiensis]PGV72099.1 hypothetical protein COD96_06430 [Bacillus thuringiensis]
MGIKTGQKEAKTTKHKKEKQVKRKIDKVNLLYAVGGGVLGSAAFAVATLGGQAVANAATLTAGLGGGVISGLLTLQGVRFTIESQKKKENMESVPRKIESLITIESKFNNWWEDDCNPYLKNLKLHENIKIQRVEYVNHIKDTFYEIKEEIINLSLKVDSKTYKLLRETQIAIDTLTRWFLGLESSKEEILDELGNPIKEFSVDERVRKYIKYIHERGIQTRDEIRGILDLYERELLSNQHQEELFGDKND